jgi:hypothetical protein
MGADMHDEDAHRGAAQPKSEWLAAWVGSTTARATALERGVEKADQGRRPMTGRDSLRDHGCRPVWRHSLLALTAEDAAD